MATHVQQIQTNHNGRARVLKTRIVYGDDGTSIALGTVPAGSLLLGLYVYVETAFNDSGTDLLEVGTSLDPDAYAKTADVNLTATGLTATGFTGAAAMPQVVQAETALTAIYNGQNSDATQGALVVVIHYAPLNN